MHFLVRGELLKNEDKTLREAFSEDFSTHHHVHFDVEIESVSYENEIFSVHIKEGGTLKTLEGD